MTTLREKLTACEERLARETRDGSAMREWFLLSERPDLPISGKLYEVEVPYTSISVRLRGLTRAAGGVAMVCTGSYRDFPRYVDDLVSEWRSDANPHIRAAAERILTLRENVLKESAA